MEELTGCPLEDIVAPKAFETVRTHIHNAFNGTDSYFSILRQHNDFGNRTLEISAHPYKAPAGAVVGALLFFADVTNKVQLAATQKELADYLAALDSHAIVAVTNINGVIVYANDKFCEISQYSREDLYGNTHRIVKSDHHSKEFYRNLWKTISSGQVWQGELCNRAKDGSLYWVHSTIVPFIGADGAPFKYIAIRADITALKNIEQQAQHLALYDPLTNLPNRRLVQDRMNQAMLASGQYRHHCALISIDLDNFKKINDTNGHGQGDLLLCKAALRLSQNVRVNDTVARMGGDEFLVILPDLSANLADATRCANEVALKLKSVLNQPYRLDQVEDDIKGGVISTPSIGVVLFQGDSVSREELLQQADIAMYCAKANGRNQIVFFDSSQQEQVNRRFQIETELRGAIARQELQLYYQPIVDEHRQTVGMEALLRWLHPTRGIVPPNSFIPIAEQTGLIVPIGYWVFETACAQLAEWQKNPNTAHWSLGVNVSARQFNDADFLETTISLLKHSGVPAERLCIELTETVLLNSIDNDIMEKIYLLKEQGVLFALDDFGTGYSSLNYLKNLPLDRLKIDQSFVQTVLDNPKTQIIVEAIFSMARSLKLEVVAEGVETQLQFEYLRSSGCPAFQGYLFGRPEPINCSA